MIYLILFFLMASLLLYVIFGGADFGAGILELIARKKDSQRTQDLTYRALGPVWEANHMWLVLAIVILFVGFPEAYYQLSNAMHIPLMIMLLGIVLRGTMFIFRHYDAVKDGSQVWYARLFAWSSFLTPLFLGMIVGGSITGQIDPTSNSFYSSFVAPWWNPYSLWLGLFFLYRFGLPGSSIFDHRIRAGRGESLPCQKSLSPEYSLAGAGRTGIVRSKISRHPGKRCIYCATRILGRSTRLAGAGSGASIVARDAISAPQRQLSYGTNMGGGRSFYGGAGMAVASVSDHLCLSGWRRTEFDSGGCSRGNPHELGLGIDHRKFADFSGFVLPISGVQVVGEIARPCIPVASSEYAREWQPLCGRFCLG